MKKRLPQKKQHPLKTQRINILGLAVDVLTPTETMDRATEFFQVERPHHIITANALMALESQKNPLIQEICNQADLVIPDSSGITWAARQLSQPVPYRIPGIDLAYRLCGLAESLQLPVYLLGGKSNVAMRAAQFLYKEFPFINVNGMRDGYFKASDTSKIFHDIEESKAKLILVAMGMPQQEIWIHEQFSHFPNGIVMGVGGTFDVWSGDVKRAPRLMQRWGMEWAYRLSKEPHRLGRIARLPQFAFKVLSSR